MTRPLFPSGRTTAGRLNRRLKRLHPEKPLLGFVGPEFDSRHLHKAIRLGIRRGVSLCLGCFVEDLEELSRLGNEGSCTPPQGNSPDARPGLLLFAVLTDLNRYARTSWKSFRWFGAVVPMVDVSPPQ